MNKIKVLLAIGGERKRGNEKKRKKLQKIRKTLLFFILKKKSGQRQNGVSSLKQGRGGRSKKKITAISSFLHCFMCLTRFHAL